MVAEMNIIVSCHIDTVFSQPCISWDGSRLKGALDNFASVFACSLLIDSMLQDIHIEFTEDEELTMDGARSLARKYNNQDTMFIVMDVTSSSKKHLFTIENCHRIKSIHINRALQTFKGQYKIIQNGSESEAWLYRDLGFAVIEVDIPVFGGVHNLEGTTTWERVQTVATAIKVLVHYFKSKSLVEIEGTMTP